MSKKKVNVERNAMFAFSLSWKRAKELNRIPKWAYSKEVRYQIYLVYLKAQQMNIGSKVKYHVDHILPLTNSLVSAFHTPANLQILTKEENIAKSNNFTPG